MNSAVLRLASPFNSETARYLERESHPHRQVKQYAKYGPLLLAACSAYSSNLMIEVKYSSEMLRSNYMALQSRKPYSAWNLVQHVLVARV
jgi:hypothetical protein